MATIPIVLGIWWSIAPDASGGPELAVAPTWALAIAWGAASPTIAGGMLRPAVVLGWLPVAIFAAIAIAATATGDGPRSAEGLLSLVTDLALFVFLVPIAVGAAGIGAVAGLAGWQYASLPPTSGWRLGAAAVAILPLLLWALIAVDDGAGQAGFALLVTGWLVWALRAARSTRTQVRAPAALA